MRPMTIISMEVFISNVNFLIFFASMQCPSLKEFAKANYNTVRHLTAIFLSYISREGRNRALLYRINDIWYNL